MQAAWITKLVGADWLCFEVPRHWQTGAASSLLVAAANTPNING